MASGAAEGARPAPVSKTAGRTGATRSCWRVSWRPYGLGLEAPFSLFSLPTLVSLLGVTSLVPHSEPRTRDVGL